MKKTCPTCGELMEFQGHETHGSEDGGSFINNEIFYCNACGRELLVDRS